MEKVFDRSLTEEVREERRHLQRQPLTTDKSGNVMSVGWSMGWIEESFSVTNFPLCLPCREYVCVCTHGLVAQTVLYGSALEPQ